MEMTEYKNSSKTLCFKVPSYMYKTKEDNSSMLFNGDDKIVNFMWTKIENSWNIEKFAQQMTKGTKGLTIVEKTDTLIVYEIQRCGEYSWINI